MCKFERIVVTVIIITITVNDFYVVIIITISTFNEQVLDFVCTRISLGIHKDQDAHLKGMRGYQWTHLGRQKIRVAPF